MTASHDSRDGCEDCPLDPERRDLLRLATGAAIGALAAAGVPSSLAAAWLPTRLTPVDRSSVNPTYTVPSIDGAEIDHKNAVILVRWNNAVYAFNLSCPHQNTALRWNESDHQFQCPRHHSKYQPDGTFISGRATRNMDRFSIARVGNEIEVDTNAMHKNDTDRAGWSASVLLMPGAG